MNCTLPVTRQLGLRVLAMRFLPAGGSKTQRYSSLIGSLVSTERRSLLPMRTSPRM